MPKQKQEQGENKQNKTKKNTEEETINTEILHRGKNFIFETKTVRLPSGRITTRDIVEHPGAVAIIPLLDKDTAILVEQYRAAAGKPS